MIIRSILFFTLLLPIAANAQRLAAITGNLTQQETMLVSWTMKAGVTCIDLSLEHADESLVFREIYFIPGICGDDLSETTYTYEQTGTIHPVNFYRVKYGFDGYSDTLQVDAPLLGSDGLVLGPQPASDFIQVNFNNPLSDSFSLNISSLSGKILIDKSGIKSNRFEVNTSELLSGIYILQLSSDYKSWTRKIVIAH